uniref:Uncharacterized protein n=1 Tax=Anguilla anguilla TaxID=7936 RepID=A0A0E9WIM4_ANGAN
MESLYVSREYQMLIQTKIQKIKCIKYTKFRFSTTEIKSKPNRERISIYVSGTFCQFVNFTIFV